MDLLCLTILEIFIKLNHDNVKWKIAIMNSDICNVGSVQRAIKKIGFESKVERKKMKLMVTHLILPSWIFNEGIRSLEKFNLIEILNTNVKSKKTHTWDMFRNAFVGRKRF